MHERVFPSLEQEDTKNYCSTNVSEGKNCIGYKRYPRKGTGGGGCSTYQITWGRMWMVFTFRPYLPPRKCRRLAGRCASPKRRSSEIWDTLSQRWYNEPFFWWGTPTTKCRIRFPNYSLLYRHTQVSGAPASMKPSCLLRVLSTTPPC
jgi:hypothetical protein